MADMNVFQNSGFLVNTGTGQSGQQIKVTPKAIKSALENIASPVVDFFTNSNNQETQEILDYPQAIEKEEMKLANMQRILGVENHNINIVF